MAHESFEDEEVARLMNDVFVSIKVDREERPDLDNIYMSVCQMMTGSGGWPMSIIMTPDKKPFFAGTYFPRESRYGRIGMIELVRQIDELWKKDRKRVINSADKITQALIEETHESEGTELGEDVIYTAYSELEAMFDEKYGGFGSAPKFPTPHNLLFLMRYYHRTEESRALEMVLKTLDAIASGGIFDHIGFGFHRYSTDRKWFLPHFEKMLYDQATLAMAYTEAFQITAKERYKETAEKIFEYVLRDMTSPENGFYSAEDADSEGVEGKFYTWSVDEIREALTNEETRVALRLYNVTDEGNFEEEATGKKKGKNILYTGKNEFWTKEETNFDEMKDSIEEIREKLFSAREKRVRPHRDDKILTDWNGLMIAALAKASAAFNNHIYSDAAKKAADFILKSADEDGRIKHRFRGGQWNIFANADDYSFIILGLIELYEATFEVKYLKSAIALNDDFIQYFWDDAKGGFYFTPYDAEKVLLRTKEVYDGAIPSGNSVAFLNLLRLSRITGNEELEQYANRLGRAFSRTVSDHPAGYTQMLAGVDFAIGPSLEIVIAGERDSNDTQEMFRALNNMFVPNKVVIFNPSKEENGEINSIAEYTQYQRSLEGQTTAYVCKNFTCAEPVTSTDEMINQIKSH